MENGDFLFYFNKYIQISYAEAWKLFLQFLVVVGRSKDFGVMNGRDFVPILTRDRRGDDGIVGC